MLPLPLEGAFRVVVGYLRDVLTTIIACPINDLGQFLPDRWRNAADQDTPTVWDSPLAEVQ